MQTLRRIAVLAVHAEEQSPEKTRRALGDELERLQAIADQVEEHGRPEEGRAMPGSRMLREGLVRVVDVPRYGSSGLVEASQPSWITARGYGFASTLLGGLWWSLVGLSFASVIESDFLGIYGLLASISGLALGVLGMLRDDRPYLAFFGAIIGFLGLLLALLAALVWLTLRDMSLY